jgi:hypothetical protein
MPPSDSGALIQRGVGAVQGPAMAVLRFDLFHLGETSDRLIYAEGESWDVITGTCLPDERFWSQLFTLDETPWVGWFLDEQLVGWSTPIPAAD